ncbi:MAG: 50S ribosomal protein L9 [Anaerolineales bacterium]|nr:50S ribosomal protein L9 [Anaerolineales bacterium]MBX3037218.1 50S ribosomal protein L9 [Anaerolineales bacterium]
MPNFARKGLNKMKVLLIKDVYKLGRAGDIKKVADGYGRNFLLPQGFAVLATEGAMKQVEKIKSQAEIRRNTQNEELKGIADQIKELTLIFPAKAGETGKLYGSITTQDIATAITEKIRFEVKRQLVDTQPIRTLGEFTARVRLTMDLVPEVKIIVHREGESIETAVAPVEEETAEKPKKSKKAESAEEPVAETAE